jgi:hypothetical protein
MPVAQIVEKDNIFKLYARFRWAVIVLVLLASLHLRFIANFNMPLISILLVLGLGSIYNLAFMVIPVRINLKKFRTSLLYLTGSFDFVFLTLLIHLSGGIESPFVLVYFLSLVAATIFGFITMAYFLVIEATVFYSGVCLLEALAFLPHYRLSDPCGTLFLDINYIFSVTFAFLVTALLLVTMTSYKPGSAFQRTKKLP